METERASMLRALSDAQARGDALGQHLESQQRQLREIRTHLLEVTDENQYIKRELDLSQRENVASRQEIRALRANDIQLTANNTKYEKQLGFFYTAAGSLLKTSGASYYVQKGVFPISPSSVADNEGGVKEDAGNQLLLLRLKVVEHLASLKQCFAFYAEAAKGTGFYPKNLRFTKESAKKLLTDSKVPSKTFKIEMGVHLLASVISLSNRNSRKTKVSSGAAASAGVSFPVFVQYVYQLSQLRYHRFQLSGADKFHKLIVK